MDGGDGVKFRRLEIGQELIDFFVGQQSGIDDPLARSLDGHPIDLVPRVIAATGGGWGAGAGPGGFFSVGPDKAIKLKLATVCLDHGLADPNPRVPYELVPIESYAKDPAVATVLTLMVRGQLDQPSAQAACWHLQNGLSWNELKAKIGVRHRDGRVEKFFTAVQLERALAATTLAENNVKMSPVSQSVETFAAR
jgi:hypothetical protein